MRNDIKTQGKTLMYSLEAFIGRKENLIIISDAFNYAEIIDLYQGYALIPMTEELFEELDDMNNAYIISDFVCMTEHIEASILNLIKDDSVCYVESEFHGGEGGHIGVVWEKGKRIYLSESIEPTMNTILKELNVVKTLENDEFDSVGLGRFRSTNKWLNKKS